MKRLWINFSKTRDFEETDYYFKTVIRRAVAKTLEYESFPYDASVSVTLTDNEYIHKLNREYRGVDRPTDVLSFPIYEDGDIVLADGEPFASLGDIVISLERAREQAREVGNTFLTEVAFLTVHSMLHLLGYDHERSSEEDALQCEKQKAIMSNLEI